MLKEKTIRVGICDADKTMRKRIVPIGYGSEIEINSNLKMMNGTPMVMIENGIEVRNYVISQ